MKRFLRWFAFILLSSVFLSCASNSGFKYSKGSGNLCGIIVDEKNRPVRNYKIVCVDSRNEYKSTVTNETGIFMVSDVLFGSVRIDGEKVGYEFLQNQEIDFCDSQRVFCYQINSVDGLLNHIETALYLEDYNEALKLIEKANVNPKSQEEALFKLLAKKILERQKVKEKVERYEVKKNTKEKKL